MHSRLTLLPLLAIALLTTAAATAQPATPELISVTKIWDQAPHNAFTDLTWFQNAWYCTFREGDGHVGSDGRIRVITSPDGATWQSTALLEEPGVDLRDPKICITPDDRLMLTIGGSVYQGNTLVSRHPRATFSRDGKEFAPLFKIARENDWLWRTTWHKGAAWGAAYVGEFNESDKWSLTLMHSEDGILWQPITKLDVPDRPNETTLRFLDDDTMMALIRREAGTRNAYLGTSKPPYTEWTFKELAYNVGGPNFIVLPNNKIWAAGRLYVPEVKTALGPLTQDAYTPTLILPSGGDTSYPGLIWRDNLLWLSYYASHEGKTSIYLAKVRLPEQ